MTLYIQLMTSKEATKPSRLSIRRITSLLRLEHHVVIASFDGFLVVDDSIVGLLVEVHTSGRTFFGLEIHKSQALCVRFEAFHIFELWANAILYTKSALKQKLCHCVCARTVILCDLHHSV